MIRWIFTFGACLGRTVVVITFCCLGRILAPNSNGSGVVIEGAGESPLGLPLLLPLSPWSPPRPKGFAVVKGGGSSPAGLPLGLEKTWMEKILGPSSHSIIGATIVVDLYYLVAWFPSSFDGGMGRVVASTLGVVVGLAAVTAAAAATRSSGVINSCCCCFLGCWPEAAAVGAGVDGVGKNSRPFSRY